MGSTLEVLHRLIVLLIQTLHVLQNGHFSVPDRGGSIHGVLFEGLQNPLFLLWIVNEGGDRPLSAFDAPFAPIVVLRLLPFVHLLQEIHLPRAR